MTAVSLLDELFARGAHYGYSRRRRHPSVAPYLYSFKNRTAIIDLEKTLVALGRAEDFLRSLGQAKRRLLLVGTKPEANQAVAAAAQRLGAPYVVSRWIGGTLTNFSEIKRRLERLAELKTRLASGEWDKLYTKQERGQFEKERNRLERVFSTITDLTTLPAALLVVDSEAEKTAVAEGRALGLPIVGLVGTDCDLRFLDYPVVFNDSSVKAIEWVLDRLGSAYLAGAAAALSVEPVSTEATVNDKP